MSNQSLPKPKIKVNLLYPQGLPQKLPALFIQWLLSYGRIILIVVEIVVLATFAMRFSLDAQISDNKELIQQNTVPITILAPEGEAIRQTQFKLQFIATKQTQITNFAQAFNQFASNVPSGVRFNNISIDNTLPQQPSFRITGTASTNTDINYFVGLLRKEPTLNQVALTSLGVDQNRIASSVTGNLKPTPNQK